MKKYISIIQAYFQLSLRFRTESILWMIMDLIPMVFMLIVWRAIFINNDSVSGVNLSQVINFYILSSIISSWTAVHFENTRSIQIKNGGLDTFLTKPHHFLLDIVLKDLAKLLFYKPISLLILMIGYVAWQGPMILNNLSFFTSTSFFSLIGLMLVAYTINFLIGYLITFMTFWFEGAQGLEHFKWMSVALFSGSIMPLALFPKWMQSIIWLLPFKYLFAVPIMVALGQYRLEPSDVIYLSATLFTLLFFVRIVWRKGIMKYSAVGS